MSKGSGGTRTISPRNKGVSPENTALGNAIEVIKKNDGSEWSLYDNGLDPKDWDMLSVEQKLDALKRGEFTGMWMDDGLDIINDYHATSKDRIVGELQEVLSNIRDGFNMEDENHFVIKFKNRDSVTFSEDLSKPLTKKEISNISWVSGGGGLASQRYWAKDSNSKNGMIQDMGFHEFVKGVEVSTGTKGKLKDVGYNY